MSKAENILKDFDDDKTSYNINEIIEFYNIGKYIDGGLYLKSWSTEDIEYYKPIVKMYTRLIGRFFASVSDLNLNDLFMEVDKGYTNNFWELIEKYKVYERVSSNTFSDLLKQSRKRLYEILKYKKLVNHYGETIRKQLISNESSAKLLLDKYEIDILHTQRKVYLPNELSAQDKELIILNYINGSNPNLNYLRIIANVKSTVEFAISDRTRLKARKRAEEEQNHLFNRGSGICIETTVSFSENQDEVLRQEVDGQRSAFIYNSSWIKDNNDYPTLLNNFIYLFEFVDIQMRFKLVNKPQEMSVFEQHLLMRSKNSYIKGISFEQKDILSKLQIVSYYKMLAQLGIRIEEIVEWFFKSFVLEEFNICGFRIKMPSEHSLFIEKCRAILPEMESVLKQFTLYVEDNSIDQELLQMSSSHLIHKDIPSLVEKKYVYGTGTEFMQATFYLFSNQCMLSYVERIGSEYDNFFDLLRNEEVSISDYKDYHDQDIEWLIDHKYIELNSQGDIKLCDIDLIYILKDLYANEVINYWRYPVELREKLDVLVVFGLARFESSLFSRPEQDYINYYLNKSSFNNALDLRNSYSHGTQPNGDDSEDIHEVNYMIFLRLFILNIIKINDDICIYTENNYKAQN